MSDDTYEERLDDFVCYAIIKGIMPPRVFLFNEGKEAHRLGKKFHECPYAQHTADALSWRIGWNDEALRTNKQET